MDLESILKEYFHCPMPFDAGGRLTEHGDQKVQELINLLRDLQFIGVINDARHAEKAIDDIIDDDTRKTPDKMQLISQIRTYIGNGGLELPEPFTATRIDHEVTFRWIERDDEYDDVFCMISREPDEIDCFMLSDLSEEDVQRLLDCVENAHDDWREHAFDVITEHYIVENELETREWIGEYWQNQASDEDNLKAYWQAQRENPNL